MFVSSGYFAEVTPQIEGLGRIPAVQQLYVEHTGYVMTHEFADAAEGGQAAGSEGGVIEDGVYFAEFHTDSTMFHVNEADEGLGILEVENGKMVIHISLVSKSILNLFPGTAEDAKKDGAVLLEPTTDKVTYSDGTTEEVYGFDVPVPALDQEFDLAIIGEKGKWYDHKVYVTNPVPAE